MELEIENVRCEAKQPGELRRSQNWIGGTRPGNAVFVPPPADHIADLLSDMERFILKTSFNHGGHGEQREASLKRDGENKGLARKVRSPSG